MKLSSRTKVRAEHAEWRYPLQPGQPGDEIMPSSWKSAKMAMFSWSSGSTEILVCWQQPLLLISLALPSGSQLGHWGTTNETEEPVQWKSLLSLFWKEKVNPNPKGRRDGLGWCGILFETVLFIERRTDWKLCRVHQNYAWNDGRYKINKMYRTGKRRVQRKFQKGVCKVKNATEREAQHLKTQVRKLGITAQNWISERKRCA